MEDPEKHIINTCILSILVLQQINMRIRVVRKEGKAGGKSYSKLEVFEKDKKKRTNL